MERSGSEGVNRPIGQENMDCFQKGTASQADCAPPAKYILSILPASASSDYVGDRISIAVMGA